MSNSGERVKQLLVIIATIGVIFINYLAGTGQINDTSPAAVSDRFPTLLTPAGYAFSIWSLIYLGLLAFSVYQALPSQINNARFLKIRSLHIANCAANCIWIYLWHYGYIGASVLAMLVILATLILINLNLRGIEGAAETWTTKVPFNIYFGWITVATILNASITLLYFGVLAPMGISTVLACLLIATAVILAIIIRRRFDFPTYALTVMWALIAIAVNQASEIIILIAAVLGAVISLIAAFTGRKKLQ